MNGHHRVAFVLSSALLASCTPTTTDTLTHAMAVLEGRSGTNARGAAIFTGANGEVTAQLYVTDAAPGSYAVKLHVTGDCSATDAASAGEAWPEVGEVGTVEVQDDGTGTLRFTSERWAIDGTGSGKDVIGKAIVMHGGGDPALRVSCGIVRKLGGGGTILPVDPGPAPVPRTATVQVWPRSGSAAYGTATFTEVQGGVEMRLLMSNLTPGNHGAHLHQVGDCSDGAGAATLGHWSLDGGAHPFHIGDVPNLQVGPDGKGTLTFVQPGWVLDAPFVDGKRAVNDVIGHAVIVHGGEDDLMSQPAGNSGARVACGVIGPSVVGPTVAVARIDARSGTTLSGQATFRAAAGTVTLQLDVAGVTPGPHAVHIHQQGDCSSYDAVSAGPHWNPAGATHGLPDGGVHHAGDIGNMTVGPDGRGSLTFPSSYWAVVGADTVLGHALVVHQGVDDGVTQPTGDAGSRAGCGLITLENQQPRAPRVAVVPLQPKSGTTAAGQLTLTETGNAVTMQLDAFGMTQGPHLVRLHSMPDCSAADALSAGDEWAVGPVSVGTVNVGANGVGRLVVMNPRWLWGDGGVTTPPVAADGGAEDKWPDGGFVRYDLAGHAVIIRGDPAPDGGAAARVSCGVIQ